MKTFDLIITAFFAVLIAICSWISIPAPVPFTLQTLGVFLALVILGGKRGSCAVFLFILLGAVGIPVFSGFKGGAGVLMGPTGGYIMGFLATGLLYWAVEWMIETRRPDTRLPHQRHMGQMPSDKMPSDKMPSDRMSSDKGPSDKGPSDRMSSNKMPSDKGPSDKEPSDKKPFSGRSMQVLRFITMFAGLILCYALGTAWFMYVSSSRGSSVSLLTALGWCVFPFIIPDILKILAALVLGSRLSNALDS